MTAQGSSSKGGMAGRSPAQRTGPEGRVTGVLLGSSGGQANNALASSLPGWAVTAGGTRRQSLVFSPVVGR